MDGTTPSRKDVPPLKGLGILGRRYPTLTRQAQTKVALRALGVAVRAAAVGLKQNAKLARLV